MSLALRGKEFKSGPGKVKVGLLREVHIPSGVEDGNPLQYSSLKNPMDREAWWATVHGIGLDTTQRLSTHTRTHSLGSMQSAWSVSEGESGLRAGVSGKMRAPPNLGWLVFCGLHNSTSQRVGGLLQLFWGKGWRLPGIGLPRPLHGSSESVM